MTPDYPRINFGDFDNNKQLLLYVLKEDDGSVKVRLNHPSHGWKPSTDTMADAVEIAEREKRFGFEPVICDPDKLLEAE